jgi:hypothetical protein
MQLGDCCPASCQVSEQLAMAKVSQVLGGKRVYVLGKVFHSFKPRGITCRQFAHGTAIGTAGQVDLGLLGQHRQRSLQCLSPQTLQRKSSDFSLQAFHYMLHSTRNAHLMQEPTGL